MSRGGHGHVSSAREAVVILLACARWRGSQGEASGADEFDMGVDGELPSAFDAHGLIRPGCEEMPKLKLGRAQSKAGWVGWLGDLMAKLTTR